MADDSPPADRDATHEHDDPGHDDAVDDHGGGDGHGHDTGHDHDHHHHDVASLGVAVVTVSSSRTLDDDPAGDTVATAFEDREHEVVTRELVPDDYDSVQAIIERLVERRDTDVVVTTGGTGITPDDITVEAIRPLFDKHLPGFGELFRARSRDEIGTKVVGTRATGGVADGTLVFSLPGSENAARLGTEEIIVAEAPHLAGLARRDADDAAE